MTDTKESRDPAKTARYIELEKKHGPGPLPMLEKVEALENVQVVESDQCAKHKCNLIKICPECLPAVYTILHGEAEDGL
jgi:hypothetical protein